MIVEVLVISIIAGLVRGGSILNLKNIRFRGGYFLLIGLAINLLSFIIIKNSNDDLGKFLYGNLSFIQVSTLFLVVVGLLFNYREIGLSIVSAGIILNMIPISLNRGRMPVAEWALKAVNLGDTLSKIKEGIVIDKILINSNTNFNFLGDIIPIEYPFPKVVSLGDIVIAMGIFLIIQKYMTLSQPLQD